MILHRTIYNYSYSLNLNFFLVAASHSEHSSLSDSSDLSGFIFDVQSNTVMAQGGTFENMKEKVSNILTDH